MIDNFKLSTFVNRAKNYSVGQIFLKGFGLITLPIFTRILSLEEFGIVSLFVYNFNVFSAIYGMAFFQSINRNYYEKKDDFGEFLSTSLITLFGLQILILLACINFKSQILFLTGLDSDLFYTVLVLSFFVPTIRIYQNLNIAFGRSELYSKIQVIRRIIIIFGCFYLMFYTNLGFLKGEFLENFLSYLYFYIHFLI